MSSIYLSHSLGRLGALLMALFQTLPSIGRLQWDWWWNRWLYHVPVHNTYPGGGNRYFETEFQHFGDETYGHGGSVVWVYLLLQLMLDYGDGRVHWSTCEKGLHIILCNAFPLLQSVGFGLILKMLSVHMWLGESPTNGMRMLANLLPLHM